ncbi:MAG: hypothetical protein ACPHOK_09995, partial [Akkermansiaceae bacterium]
VSAWVSAPLWACWEALGVDQTLLDSPVSAGAYIPVTHPLRRSTKTRLFHYLKHQSIKKVVSDTSFLNRTQPNGPQGRLDRKRYPLEYGA